MAVGQRIVNHDGHLPSYLSQKLDLIFAETILVKSPHNQETQHTSTADQWDRALMLDFPIAQSQVTCNFCALLVRVQGGMPAVTFARRLVCSNTSWTCLRIGNDVEQIE